MNIKAIVASGIIASLVIAMLEMVVEAVISNGAGFFGAPIAIGATIVRDLQGSPNPIRFDGAALGLGLMGHMMNSIILAAVFGLLVGRRALSTSALAVAGMAWGLAVFAVMWFVVAPLVDPLMLNLNAAAFALGHLMWGAALGLAWARFGGTRASVQQFA
jgi:hypothetical protein